MNNLLYTYTFDLLTQDFLGSVFGLLFWLLYCIITERTKPQRHIAQPKNSLLLTTYQIFTNFKAMQYGYLL